MKLDHIALYVSDLEHAKQFFIKYFGAVSNDLYHNPRTGLKTYFLTFDPMRRGYIHVSFSVGSKDCVDTLTRRLEADGYNVLSGPRTTGDGYYESCIEGFEGNLIEITE